jgi:probable rRNA maturation factor
MEDRELSIVLMDDERIRRLNRNYRGIDQPTDVLAFPQQQAGGRALRSPPRGTRSRPRAGVSSHRPLLLGDVVVSVPTARRQARSRGRDVVDEITWLLAHGVLHLLGWDHDTAARDRRMRQKTERLCGAFASGRETRRTDAR